MNPERPSNDVVGSSVNSSTVDSSNEDLEVISQSVQNEKKQPQLSIDLAEQERKSKFLDGQRGEAYKVHIHRMVVAGIYVVSGIMIMLILFRAYHLVAPVQPVYGFYFRWLNNSQLHDIERILFSSIILGLATKYFRYYKMFERRDNE